MKIISAAVGATMAAAGLAKLLRISAYEDLVADLDWTDEERQAIGISELVGGLLMLAGSTRRLGVGVVLAASGAALSVELRSKQAQLSTPRAGIMLATLLLGAAPDPPPAGLIGVGGHKCAQGAVTRPLPHTISHLSVEQPPSAAV